MDFAVVGMDCLLPGSAGLEAWTERGRSGESALGPVPAGRWPVDAHKVLNERLGAVDCTLTVQGGFVESPVIDPEGLDLDGVPLDALDPVYRQVLAVTRGALGGRSGDRVDLVLANLSLASTGAVRAASAPYRPWLRSLGVDTAWLEGGHALDLLQSAGPAQVAAKALGLGGRASSLDAACASGLYAVQVACERLAAGEADLVVAAGVNRADSSYLFLGFSQLRALSRTGTSRPFDHRADGLLVGEGAAAVAIKRLADAVREGDTIHAVLRGGGLGNDGRKGNLLAPSAEGQARTLHAAYERAGVEPADIGYVECHATGTPLGDQAEVEALYAVHEGRPEPLVLASTKGVIGHTITVAGLAGLLRAVAAVRDGVLPASPGCQPIEWIDGHTLRVVHEPTPWTAEVRRAGVSAFGFGGTNAHLVVEEYKPSQTPPQPSVLAPRVKLAVVGAGALIGQARGCARVARALLDGQSLLREPSARLGRDLAALPRGAWVESLEVDTTRYRVPPTELAQMLPQQLAVLLCADEALASVSYDPERTGAVLGMNIDLHVADSVIRQVAPPGPLRDAIAPALTASRVQGSLPNFVANRLAAWLDLQAPSYTVSADEASGLEALAHAERLLASGAADTVLVGASDFRHLGNAGSEPVGEGAIVLVVRRAEDARAAGQTILAELSGDDLDLESHRAVVGHCGALDGAVGLLAEVLRQARARGLSLSKGPPGNPTLVVPHGAPSVGELAPRFTGAWGGDTVPAPLPLAPYERPTAMVVGGPARPAMVPLTWTKWVGAPEPAPAPPPVVRRRPSAAAAGPIAHVPVPSAPLVQARTTRPAPSLEWTQQVSQTSALVASLARSTQAMADAHDRFLAEQQQADAQVAAISTALERAVSALSQGGLAEHKAQAVRRPQPPVEARAPLANAPRPPVQRPAPASTPRSFDRAALERFAAGTISEVLGPAYADLDAIEPRVRLPKHPLLLVSRIVDVQGERGRLTLPPGADRSLPVASMVTEYDLDPGADWNHDGKPPPCVVVESGQADLFLCAYLGTDAICKGERLYRLLDCDLTFHCDRPAVGETLRHDIRIKRFARLGDTLLFYFEYDCVAKSDGRRVLTMRNGVAGFFTPKELSVPQGVDKKPADLPKAKALTPVLPGAPSSLDDAALGHLKAGRFSQAFGPAFAPADGSKLTLANNRWGLIARVPKLQISGGPHGLGGVWAEQDLRDDDWFNPVHFQGDPCMPGTLMFDGCLQALQVWMLAHGFAAEYPNATFEPLPEVATRLRCRGQVVPGHSKLAYEVQVKQAGLEPAPWAIADVILHVDGTPVVHAADVSVILRGERKALPAKPPAMPATQADLLEFAIGEPSRAFGTAFAPYDGDVRTPRIPGPPLLMMHRITAVDTPQLQVGAGCHTVAEYDLAPDAWFFEASPGQPLPWAALLEIALQPCGWTTAWQGCALQAGGDVYFRNLGGTSVQHVDLWPDSGTLTTTAHLTSVSRSAGMTITSFDFVVRAGDTLVLEGKTTFGYFTAEAMLAQKGLPADPEGDALREGWRKAGTLAALPLRADWSMVDAVTSANPHGGRAGLGYYEAVQKVDPSAWFFTAHFHQDPVMPGSLGLEGLAQLARTVLADRLGRDPGPVAPVGLGNEVKWTYRGQVIRERDALTYQLEVTDLDLDSATLTAKGRVLVDGKPIYAFDNFRAQAVQAPVKPTPAPREATAALLDHFTVQGDTGTGTLRLDPARHPWLADHCPTLVIPAVPMAFAAEIAAEAALLLRPGSKVIGLPEVKAEKWLTAEQPTELLVVAIAEGDTVAVTLAVYQHNERFPKLSGPVPHMRAIVQVGSDWAPPPPEPEPLQQAQPANLSVRAYYDGGWTFHGPVLQGMTDLGERGPQGAVATFKTRADTDLLPPGSPGFVLDPLLLDTATHPMMSGKPELWQPTIPAGRLAYPVQMDDLRFHGPRPTGVVTCRLDLVEASNRGLVFDVHLSSEAGPWATYRWTETLVPGGPLLGRTPDEIATFCKQRQPLDVHLGRPVAEGWQVQGSDLVEPLEGTIARLYCSAAERAQVRGDLIDWLAAKEAVRAWLLQHLGRDVHPSTLALARTRPDRFVCTNASTLTADEHITHLGPTRVVIHCQRGIARVDPFRG